METCPPVCPLKDNGCYADGGPLALHWRKLTEGDRGMNWQEFLSAINNLPQGQVWRHNQAGDLVPHCTHNCNQISSSHLLGLSMANIGKKGFTYTHYPVEGEGEIAEANRDSIKQALEMGFVVNLSANDLKHADTLYSLDFAPVTVQVASHYVNGPATFTTPGGNKVLVCPAARCVKSKNCCATCKLCAKHPRKYIIGFPAHGSRAKLVDKYLSTAGD